VAAERWAEEQELGIMMDFTDQGLWIHGVSKQVGEAIKAGVFAFRAHHQLPDSAWHVRVYGLPGEHTLMSGSERRQIRHTGSRTRCSTQVAAGEKVRSLLEQLLVEN
jgi:hypothetical protein